MEVHARRGSQGQAGAREGGGMVSLTHFGGPSEKIRGPVRTGLGQGKNRALPKNGGQRREIGRQKEGMDME